MNHVSVAHKITVFKEQNQQNMHFTQKHNSMNVEIDRKLKEYAALFTNNHI